MCFSQEEAYNDGFIDGQIDTIEEVLDILDKGESFETALEFLENKKREIESL